jgi:glycosyltransferase involved in cell wall biosynthesis
MKLFFQRFPTLYSWLLSHYASLIRFPLFQAPFAPIPGHGGKKRILVDVSNFVKEDQKTGIQRVLRNILREMLTNAPQGYEIQPVWCTVRSRGFLYASVSLENNILSGVRSNETAALAPGDIFVGLDFSPVKILAQTRNLQKMREAGVRICFLLHDILPIQLPQYFPQYFPKCFTAWLREICRHDGIVCVSQTVCEEMAQWMRQNAPESAARLSWFHPGYRLDQRAADNPADASVDKALAQADGGVATLMVSTVEPRKGHAQVLDAFDLLWREGLDITLLVVGKKGWNVDALAERMLDHPQAGKQFFWLRGVSDAALGRLYDKATVVLMASEGEGFGLSILEAAAHGKPLVLRDIPVFREVAGEHAFYFSGHTGAALAGAVKAWLAAYRDKAHPRSDGIKIRSWNEAYRDFMEHVMPGNALL